MASPSVRAYTQVTPTAVASSFTINKPTGTTNGDAMLLLVTTDYHTAVPSVTTPTGWALLQHGVGIKTSAGATGDSYSWLFGRTASSEPSSYTVDISNCDSGIAYWYDLENSAGGIAASAASYSSSGGTPAVAPAVTATTTDTCLLAILTSAAGVTFATPSSMSLVADVQNAGGSGTSTASGWTEAFAATGSTGSKSSAISGATAGWCAFSVLIASQAAAPSSQPYRRPLFDEAPPLDEPGINVERYHVQPPQLNPPFREPPQLGPELVEEILSSPRRFVPQAPLSPASIPRRPPAQVVAEVVEEASVNVRRTMPGSAIAGYVPPPRRTITLEDLPEPAAEFVRRRLAPAGTAATKYFTLQHYRGSSAGLPDLVLADGEFWIATDTATLYVGLAGTVYKLCVGTAT